MMKNGFTLVEVLIGLSIATIAAVSVAYTIASTNKVADAGKKTFVAINLAHEGLELTRLARDNNWLKKVSNWTDQLCGTLQYPIDSSLALFTRTVVVDCADASSNPAFVKVTSTVNWTSPKGETKTVELQEKLYNWYVEPKV